MIHACKMNYLNWNSKDFFLKNAKFDLLWNISAFLQVTGAQSLHDRDLMLKYGCINKTWSRSVVSIDKDEERLFFYALRYNSHFTSEVEELSSKNDVKRFRRFIVSVKNRIIFKISLFKTLEKNIKKKKNLQSFHFVGKIKKKY